MKIDFKKLESVKQRAISSGDSSKVAELDNMIWMAKNHPHEFLIDYPMYSI